MKTSFKYHFYLTLTLASIGYQARSQSGGNQVVVTGPHEICDYNLQTARYSAQVLFSSNCGFGATKIYNWSVTGASGHTYYTSGSSITITFNQTHSNVRVSCTVKCDPPTGSTWTIGSYTQSGITVDEGVSFSIDDQERCEEGDLTFSSPYSNTAWYVNDVYIRTGTSLSQYFGQTSEIKAIYTDECNNDYEATATATISPLSAGGTAIGGGDSFGPKSGTLQCINEIGNVKRWEYQIENGPWTWASFQENYSYSNIAESRKYRAVVQSGSCPLVYSGIASINIFEQPYIIASQTDVAMGSTTEISSSHTDFSSYEWIKNGTTLPGEYAPNYLVSTPGEYKLRVKSSPFGLYYTTDAVTIGRALDNQRINFVSEATMLKEGVPANVDFYTLATDDLAVSTVYYDGVGRAIQQVQLGHTPSGKDLVQPSGYDKFGRKAIDYLPYTSVKRDGKFQHNALQQNDQYTQGQQYQFYQIDGDQVANDPFPYAARIIEISPLNRTLKQGAPGESWQPDPDLSITSDNVLHYRYEVNIIDEVFVWDIDFTTDEFSATGYYPQGQLTKTITTDEEGHAVIEFVDKLGQTILKRVQVNETATEWADTYYVYDDFGNLRYVLPPEGVREMGNPSTFPYTPSSSLLAQWAFQYNYDGRNRMVEKKVPGAEWVYMIYDDRDRLVLTQDGNQHTNGEWLFTKYDALNRPVSTGLYTNATYTTQAAMQDYVDSRVGDEDAWYESRGTAVHGYDNQSFPRVGDGNAYLTVTYYDDYSFRALPGFGSSFHYQRPDLRAGGLSTPQGTYDYEAATSETVKGQVTGVKVKIMNTNEWTKTATYYDERYRVIQTVTANDFQGLTERASNLYNFPGWLLETYKAQTHNGQAMGVRKRYVYDHTGRLLEGYHELYENGTGQGEVLLAQNKYNELGELIEKNLHVQGGTPAQSMDFRYTIRGWLESINSANRLQGPNNDDTGQPMDFFGMQLMYQTVVPGLDTEY